MLNRPILHYFIAGAIVQCYITYFILFRHNNSSSGQRLRNHLMLSAVIYCRKVHFLFQLPISRYFQHIFPMNWLLRWVFLLSFRHPYFFSRQTFMLILVVPGIYLCILSLKICISKKKHYLWNIVAFNLFIHSIVKKWSWIKWRTTEFQLP